MGGRSSSGSLAGLSMKHLSLITLTFQNSALILIMHYSRVMPVVGGQRYHTSTSVFLNEVLKLGVSLTMALYDMSKTLPSNTTVATLFQALTTAMFTNESWKLAIPALLYTLQNTLQYVAVSNLDAATFQVTYQLKILTTAMFSVLMLGRSLSPRRWLSLLVLVIGVSIVQLPEYTSEPATMESLRDPDSKVWPRSLEELRDLGSQATAHFMRRSGSYEGIKEDRGMVIPEMNSSVGLTAVLVACALSGIAGVSFEKILKESTSKNTSLWVRNCQLSFWSLFPALFLGVIWKDGEIIARTGFFVGYNWVVWAAITFQAMGGVIVALVINYADNIAKNFATSISIIISCAVSVALFDFKVTGSFFVGTLVVLFATYLYTKPEPGTGQVKIASFEKTTVDRRPPSIEHEKDGARARGNSTSRSATPSFCTDHWCMRVNRHFKNARPNKFRIFNHGHANQTRPRYIVSQPQFTHVSGSFAPRERYRATHYDHPMSDAVEDESHGQLECLQPFDDQMLHQSYQDRQHRTIRGQARLSMVPMPRSYSGEMVEKVRPESQNQHICEKTPDKRGTVCQFAYDAYQPLEPTSDVSLGASSSPTLNAGRRRAEHYKTSAFRQPLELEPFEDLPLEAFTGRREGTKYHQKDDAFLRAPRRDVGRPFQQVVKVESNPNLIKPSHALPTVQGIPLVPVSALPDRLRIVFPFPTFNAVQSKCFDQVFRSNHNFVLSSPTGSGKTAILELAVCRAVATNSTGQYKIVYQAPTKALCSERQRDWDNKFTQIGLKCAELTGDSDGSDLRNVQSANIIITTPEKWDSMTRKWKDHERLMRLIKLFLIDEVHILNDDRGAVLEAVVSRMKSISTDVRFVALSATVPNFHDVATWLGRNSLESDVPAPNERFGEEFRPVKLRKHVCGYVCNSNNDWAFEKQLDARLPEIISKYSERKPMMIFCATRKSCAATARLIKNWWVTRSGPDRLWDTPSQALQIKDKDLRDLVDAGVAFHHAGVDQDDRIKVEKGFLQGDISVICCTSTLAVGVNLPCHLVIIKNTVSWSQEGLQEYSDLDMMQMLGRAGRPQFDNSAVAVIMTRQTKVRRYETLVTGQEILESKLHLNLIEHVNAEIGLGTIRDLDSARKWLTGTFLYVRLRQNPVYYKLEGSRSGQEIQEQVDDICVRDIAILKEYNLAIGEDHLRCTEFGHAMARYYIRFETMRVIMGLQPKATLSEILSAVAQAAEFSKIRFRQGEKSIYKILNRSPSIRFPIPVNLDLPAQKVSLIIQSVLGHAEICWDGDASKHKQQFSQEVAVIFKSINSLVRCVIDCQLVLGDSVSIHSALMLERCLGSKAWDDSPLQMVQIPNVGAVTVRKFVNAGIRGIEDLEATDARRIDTVAGRNPPFGLKVLDDLKSFPKLRVSLHLQSSSVSKTTEGVKVQVKADIGFINEKAPVKFGNKLIYVCMLAETSDGRKIHFARIKWVFLTANGSKLSAGQSLVFPALLTSVEQSINCYLMCEGIGIMRDATIAPRLAPSLFPPQVTKAAESASTQKPNISRRRLENTPVQRKRSSASDDFGDADIDDDALVGATDGALFFEHIDNFAEATNASARTDNSKQKAAQVKGRAASAIISTENDEDPTPVQLPNGRWSCNHKCKDKGTCKHYCCKHGMDRPPKKAGSKRLTNDHHEQRPSDSSVQECNKFQTKLQLTASKRKNSAAIEELDLTQQEKKRKKEYGASGPHDYRDLHNLHQRVQKKSIPSSLHSVMHRKPEFHYGEGGEYQLSFLTQPIPGRPKTSSEYGDLEFDEFATTPSPALDRRNLPNSETSLHFSDKAPVTSRGSETFGDDDSMFSEAIVGLADSQDLQRTNVTKTSGMQDETHDAINRREEYADVDFPVDFDFAATENSNSDLPEHLFRASIHEDRQAKPLRIQAPFVEATSSPEQTIHFKLAPSLPQDKQVRGPQPSTIRPPRPVPVLKADSNQENVYSGLASLLDIPISTNKTLVASRTPAQPVQPKTMDTKQVPDGFEDLQPWLFQEFGDIVELVD
ncbi:nucleotide-sugar transporter-domain-containing protein [Boeremia exigua]|uniref:nucleotide-sugar transporter-domain-containing protein n=1 Tax=Boeremia exigua TaxID=749465 RepID=UPI001E8D8998|nr:nucleotide-sugar transporter-domain-containing protein [Boeremia exigua]KAH6633045.1 nucleotide-sugar transporter-domain-containing protein [Boeremia exigua]